MRYLVLTGLFFRAILCGQAANDPPIRSAFKQAEPTLTRTFLLRRTQVDGSLDLVLAMASSQHLSGPIAWWGEKDKLGLFLQERSNPNRVYTLTLAPGFADCSFRILRATATDAVIQCTGEKSTQYPNQKFVYDIRAKKLIGQFSYQPFSMRRILSRSRNGALIAGTDGTRQIAVEFPTFRLLSHTEELKPAPEFQPISFGGGFRLTQETRTSMGPQPLIVDTNGKKYQLPYSNFEAFAQSRPERVKDGYKPPLEFDDHIGPYKVEGSNLWFGKSFYDGEGITGIGGFGYFDATEKKFHLYGPPEILE